MGAWETYRGEVATATGHDLERLVLPVLRLFWLELVQAPSTRAYDRAGIDLVQWGSDATMQVVVQCKGFYSDDDLTQSHKRQMMDSIDAFYESGFACDDYLLLHNRRGKNVEVTREVQSALDTLVETGKAKRARLWDRTLFVKEARQHLRSMILQRLKDQSQRRLDRIRELFRFGDVHVPIVPVQERRLVLARWQSPHTEPLSQTDDDVARRILPSDDDRWSLLIGEYGSGKTTAALHAAVRSKAAVAFVRCSDLELHGSLGTNLILGRMLRVLRLFDDYSDEDRAVLDKLLATTLAALLRGKAGDTVLVFDGLDENRSFQSADGMAGLANSIGELECKIVLTTRREHFNATIGNFDTAFNELSRKTGKEHVAKVLELTPWKSEQIASFLDQAAAASQPHHRNRLANLADKVRRGEQDTWPNDLLAHPLFLQMIAELAADGMQGTENPATTIRDWAAMKMRRDLEVARLEPEYARDKNVLVHQLMQAMQRVAAAMIHDTDRQYELRETIDSSAVEAIVASTLGVSHIDIGAITGVSLLMPVSERYAATVPVMFSHRAFQEYFTASDVIERERSVEKYPAPVQRLAADLLSATA